MDKSRAHEEPEEQGFQGGFASNPELAKEAGRKGGAVVREKYGQQFYRDIGRKGGEAVRDKRGPDYYADIGRRGGEARAARIRKKSPE